MAISRSKVKIYIVDADTVPSTLAASDVVDGEITSYSKSGGEVDVESVAAFGGFIDKEKPQSQFEISFDIVPSLTSTTEDTMRWDALAYYDDSGTYTSASVGADKMVVIQAKDGSNYKSVAFNNCNVTVLDMEHSADDNQTYSLTLKFSPTDADGTPNFQSKAVVATALGAFSALTKSGAI